MALVREPLVSMDGPVELAQVIHQRACLRVDPGRYVLHGVTDLYIRPGRQRVVALHARNLQIDEVRVNGIIVATQWLQRHMQKSADESAEHSPQDYADYVADDYRAALKAERTQGDLVIPLDVLHTTAPSQTTPGGGAPPNNSPDRIRTTPTPAPTTAAPAAALTPADFQHCSEAFRQCLLNDPQLASSVKLTIRYRKLGQDSAVRYFRGLMTTDTVLNRARAVVPCVDLPGSLQTWEVAVEAGLTDVAVVSGNLVSQKLLVGTPPPPPPPHQEGEELPATTQTALAAAAPGCAVSLLPGELGEEERRRQLQQPQQQEGPGQQGQQQQQLQQGGSAAESQAGEPGGPPPEGKEPGISEMPGGPSVPSEQGQVQAPGEAGGIPPGQGPAPMEVEAAEGRRDPGAAAAALAAGGAGREGDAMDVDSGAQGGGAGDAATAPAAAGALVPVAPTVVAGAGASAATGQAGATESAAVGGTGAGVNGGEGAPGSVANESAPVVGAGAEPMDVDRPALPPGQGADSQSGEEVGGSTADPAAATADASSALAGLAGGPPPAAPRTPHRAAAPPHPGRPRPYGKVWYYEQPVAVAPCHLHVTVGPLAVVPQYQGSTNQLVESFLKQQQSGAGGGPAGGGRSAPDSTVITHFALPGQLAQLQATTRFFYLPFKEFQIASTVNFPLSQLQVVFIPSELAQTPVQVAAGCVVASSELLHSDTAVEAALDGKMALAEALARQWFGVILQPRSSSDVWLVEGLAGLLADHFFKAWLGQNEVGYRRCKEREAVLAADDGQPPPLCPQNQYDDEDEGAEGGGGGAPAGGQGAPRRRRKDPLSQMYGSEALDPSPLRRWKAVTVLRMLEKRTGEDSFRSIMQALCRNAANALRQWSAARPGSAAASTRLLSTRRFVAECGTAAGMSKDVAAFAERWVYGRGCPRLTAGFTFVRRSNTLLVALKQEGGPEVVAAGRSASAQRSKSETSGRGVKVAVYDHDGAVQEVIVERMEPHVDAVVHEIELTSKPGQRGRRKRGGGGGGGGGGDGDDDEGGGGGTQPAAAADENRIPVQYFRVDPSQEWLCDVVVLQTEAMWAAQLRNSKDVVAQSLAVQGLMRLGLQLESSGAADSSSVIGVLLEAVRNAGVYCRVRIEAARALAAFSASMSTQPAAPNLLSYFYDQCRDPASGVLRPNYWSDLGTHLVLQAIPACLASIRDVSFNSTPEALQLVTDILTNNDNSENLYDDSSYLAAVIEAAGLLRPTHASQLARLLSLLDDYLLRDCLHPSPNYAVGAACLTALTSLALSVNPRQGRGAGAEAKALELYGSVRRQLMRFVNTAATDAAATGWNPPSPLPTGAGGGAAGGAGTAPGTALPGTATDTAAQLPNGNGGGSLALALTTTAPAASPVPHASFQPGHPPHRHPHHKKHHGPGTGGDGVDHDGDCCPPPHHLLRRAAYQCLLRLEAAEAKVMSSRRGAAAGGPEGKPASRLVALALRLVAKEPLPALRQAVMVEALAVLGAMQVRVLAEAREEGTASQPGALVVPVSAGACAALYGTALAEGTDPRVRHLAFMALQVITSQPPSLYRSSPEDALATEEALPEPSNVTGRPPKSHVTGHHPAAAGGGPARSIGTAGQAAAASAGTAAAAAQAAPALKRIKMPLVRQGTAAAAAAAAAASGPDGSVGAAAGVAAAGPPAPPQGPAGGSQPGGGSEEAATTTTTTTATTTGAAAAAGRCEARSPHSVALREPSQQTASHGPCGEAPVVQPPEVATDLTPSTNANTAAASTEPSAAAVAATTAPAGPPVAKATPPSATAMSPPSAATGSPSPPRQAPSPRGSGGGAAAGPRGSARAGREGHRSPPRDPRIPTSGRSRSTAGGGAGAAAASPGGDTSPERHAASGPGTRASTSPKRPTSGQPPGQRAPAASAGAHVPPRPPGAKATSPPKLGQDPGAPGGQVAAAAAATAAGRSPKRAGSGGGAATVSAERGPSPTRPQSRFAPSSAQGAGGQDRPGGSVAAEQSAPAEKAKRPAALQGPASSPERGPSGLGPSSPTAAAGAAAAAAAAGGAKRPPPPARPRPPQASFAPEPSSRPSSPTLSAPAPGTAAAAPEGKDTAAAQPGGKTQQAATGGAKVAPKPRPAASAAAGVSAPGPSSAAPSGAAPVRVRAWPAARPPRPDAAAAAAKTGDAGAVSSAQTQAPPAAKAKAGPEAAGVEAAAVPPAGSRPPPQPTPDSNAAAGAGGGSGAVSAATRPRPSQQQGQPEPAQQHPQKVPPTGATAAAAGAPAAAAAPTAAPLSAAPRGIKIKIKPVGASATAAAAAAAAAAPPLGDTSRAPLEPPPALQTALSRRMSVAGSTGGPPPAVHDGTPTLPARASACKLPPQPLHLGPGAAATAAAGTPVSAPQAGGAGGGSQPPAAAPRPKLGLKIKLTKRPDVNVEQEPPAPAVSTASAAPPFRSRPALEADAEFKQGDTDGSQRGKPMVKKRS